MSLKSVRPTLPRAPFVLKRLSCAMRSTTDRWQRQRHLLLTQFLDSQTVHTFSATRKDRDRDNALEKVKRAISSSHLALIRSARSHNRINAAKLLLAAETGRSPQDVAVPLHIDDLPADIFFRIFSCV